MLTLAGPVCLCSPRRWSPSLQCVCSLEGIEPIPPRHVGPCSAHYIQDSCSLHSALELTQDTLSSKAISRERNARPRNEVILLAWHRREAAVHRPGMFQFAFGVWQDISDALAAGMLLAVPTRTHPLVL